MPSEDPSDIFRDQQESLSHFTDKALQLWLSARQNCFHAKDIFLNQRAIKGISSSCLKVKDALCQNKEALVGVGLVALTYWLIRKNNSSTQGQKTPNQVRHPISRQGSGEDGVSNPLKSPKLAYEKGKKPFESRRRFKNVNKTFISEGEEDYCSEQVERFKEEQDDSISTRRTDNVSDVEQGRRAKRGSLIPIMDMTPEEEEESEDKVFFEVFESYKHS